MTEEPLIAAGDLRELAGDSAPRRPRRVTDLIVVHCAATPPEMDVGAREIRAWHRARGWRDIGYHLVIRRSGGVERGRALMDQGAHCRGHNHRSVGVCLVGGLSADKRRAEANFTPAQYASLDRVVTELAEIFPAARLIGHRDAPGAKTTCPSFEVGVWAAIRRSDPARRRPAAGLGRRPDPRLGEGDA